MMQSHKIDKLRRIFIISRRDVLDHHIGNILHFAAIIPDRLKQLHILSGERCFHSVSHIIAVVAPLTAYIDRGKTSHWHIGDLFCRRIHRHKALHVFPGDIGFENSFPSDPICAFFCNGFLRHLVAQFDLKFCSVQTALTV